MKHSSFPKQELFSGLAAIVQVENGSPVPVKCTKKLYSAIVSHVTTVSIIPLCQVSASYINYVAI